MYWRKPMYKFIEFHLEHLPLNQSIKWIIELWLTYIQTWKFSTNQLDSNALFEFIKENFIMFTDIYHQILKRYCLSDLTNEDNLLLIHRVLMVFANQKDIIKKRKKFLIY